MLLPESSCKACERETSQFEEEWLRSSFYSARVQKGLGKKKKRPPRCLPLKVQVNGKTILKSIPIEKYPPMVVTLLFDRPDILSDIEPTEKELSGGVAIGILPTFGQRMNEYLTQGTVIFEPPRSSATSRHLGRMLAKIAHSYAVAELGLNGFKPFLRQIILGTDVRYLPHYVGGTREVPSASEHVYEIKLTTIQSKGSQHYLATIIRLLSDMQGMPEYWVVVGKNF